MKIKEIKEIMEISKSDKIIILTEHSQIIGKLYNECDSCKNDFINLREASVCLINDVYETEMCDKYTSSHYEWLHINTDKIVAFSFQK